MKLRLDRSEPMLSRQIFDQLRQQILGGQLLPGQTLPTQRALAQALRVHRSTVAEAYAELASLGLVEARVGQGTRVAAQPSRYAVDWQGYLEGGAFPPDPALLRRTQALRERPGIISLAHGEPAPDLWPRASLQRVLAEADWQQLPLGYGPPEGLPALREVVAQRLAARGLPVGPENVLIVSGAQQGFHIVALGLLAAGDAVALETPSYLQTLPIFRLADLRPLPWPSPQTPAEIAALTQLTRHRWLRLAAVAPTYANPTGHSWSPAVRQAFLEVCRNQRLAVLEDDPYAGLALAGPEPVPLAALDQHGSVLYLGTLSKLAGPGLRVGWLAGPTPVIARLSQIKYELDHGTDALAEWAVATWMNQGEDLAQRERLRASLQTRLAALEEALASQLGRRAAWSTPAGGYHLWCRLDSLRTSAAICEEAAAEGVAVMPGAVYGPERPGEPHLRLSFCHADEPNLREGVRRLARALARLG